MYVDNLAKIRKLHDHITTTEKELKDSKDSLFKAEVKVEAITEYFQHKERKIYSTLNNACKIEKICTGSDIMKDCARDAQEAKCDKLKGQLEKEQQEKKDLEISCIDQINDHMKKTNEAVVSNKKILQFIPLICIHVNFL